ncbi:MAG TPA: acyl-CoA dehydrogenase family protein [Solirubrobacterales bacterium]|nr:acyl-CoA dehydrogenase family protein [Solirubrobacterales bacterium]
MDFEWSSRQRELHEAAVEAARRIGGATDRGAGRDGFRTDAWRAAGEFGLAGLDVPTEYGGLGLDCLTTARVIEGFGEGCTDLGLLFSVAAHLFACCGPIAKAGSPALRERFLPGLARGEAIGANAITEAEAGSDVMALRTRAKRAGGGYSISGEKTFVTNAPVADVTVVYACTEPNGGYLSLSAFAVERGTPGFLVGEPFEKIGLQGSPTGSVYLRDSFVPAANLIGTEGQGALIFKAAMQVERACLFAAYLGAMSRQLEEVLSFAGERRQFGHAIGKNQAISHRVVDMKLRLESARLLVYRACWLLDRGRDAMIEVSLAKIAVSEAAIQSGLDAIQIHGGLGVVSAAGVDRTLRDALPAPIVSGTSEIQRDIVAARLGL